MNQFGKFLVLFIFIALTSSSRILQCPSNDNKCYCSEFGEVEIQCPRFEPRIFVRIQPNNFLNLECENTTSNDYNLIPDMTLSEAQMIKIVKCPMLHGKSIATYFQNLHVQKVLWLQIFSSGANTRNSLEPSHLGGFEEITRFLLSGVEGEFSDLPSNLFKDLTKISWVTIRVINIQLPADIFTPLENLEFLELGHNKMNNLASGLLRNNKKLQRLNLWGNNLRNLDKETFKGLENLQELDLSTNGMESIERDLFAYLTNLTHLNLGGNNFVALPEALFVNNPKLTVFKLLENREIIDTMPDGFLANKTMLTDVYIRCRLRKIPENIFEGSTSIVNIKLDGNELDVIPELLFDGLKSLERLDLSKNLLTTLPQEIFVTTRALSVLNLSNNRLTSIPPRIFQKLQQLTEINLNNNQLTSLEQGIFTNLYSLKFIDLSNNRISFGVQVENLSGEIQVGSRFAGLNNLEHLNLRNNSITEIFEDFTLSNLKELDLSYNNITKLSKTDLQYSTQDEVRIDLRFNQITDILFKDEIDEDGLQKRQVLLDHNPLKCDCRLLHFIKFTKNSSKSPIEIDTKNLRCASPERMEGKVISSLQPLDLKCLLDDANSNKEKRCPAACISCEVRPEDKTLLMNCQGNLNIDSLPIVKNLNLKNVELKLENQSLKEFPSSTSPAFKQITKLFLSNNQIRHITQLPPNLVELDLRNNQIDMMNETVRESFNFTSLMVLRLSGNPWKCQCETRDFINFAFKHREQIHDYSEMTCANGEYIKDLSSDDLCSGENFIIVIASIILGVSSLIIGVLAALYYKYQKQIKMWLYSHNLCLWFVTEEELDKDKTYDAFVSYAHQDGDFITDHLVPQLENCAIPYKLCLHERDWLPGLEISCKFTSCLNLFLSLILLSFTAQISSSINDSKRTIVVMSPHYLNSQWAQWEFRVAQSHAATEKRSRIIVILYGDIGDINKLEPDIRDYLKLNTYVKWGDKWFWEKLRYAMPHVKGQGPMDKSKGGGGLVKTAIKSSVDDKLELIKPVSITPPQLTTPPAEKIANPLITKLNAKNTANSIAHSGNGFSGHINGAFVINTSSRQSDV